MHKLSKVALLAVLAGVSAVPSAMAAPSFSPQQLAQYCADPAHAQSQQCTQMNQGGGQNQGTGQNHGNKGMNGTGGTAGTNATPPPQQGGNPSQGSNGPSLSFNFSSGDRNQFHQRFRGFNFGSFGTPNFSISIGGRVPHSYSSLKPVPRSIYRYYPQFRGYLFFEGRHGDIVIVSPKTYRIVTVI